MSRRAGFPLLCAALGAALLACPGCASSARRLSPREAPRPPSEPLPAGRPVVDPGATGALETGVAPPPPAPVSVTDRLLSGFDPPRPFVTWRTGARALYAIRLTAGEREQLRYVLFECRSGPLADGTIVRVNEAHRECPPSKSCLQIADPDDRGGELIAFTHEYEAALSLKGAGDRTMKAASASMVVRVAVYDESGALLGCNHALLPEGFLRRGLFHAVQTAAALHATATTLPAEAAEHFARDMLEGFAALSGYGRAISGTPALNRLARGIVPTAPLVQSFFAGRFELSVDANFAEARPSTERLPPALRGRLAYHVPITLRLNDEPIIHCALDVLLPDPPLDVGGGVVAFEGARVDDAARRFDVQLLAARGPAEPVAGVTP